MPFLHTVQTDMEPPKNSYPITPLTALSNSSVRVNQIAHEDGPEHQFQINQTLLYEHEFRGQTYVSAHLQRLQNGIFAHDNLHLKAPMHVTFVAVTFTLHPASSTAHRFTNAVVEITANDITEDGKDGSALRFIKYAPHLAYGRISTETLKWDFKLSAALGVTQGPANVSVNPSMSRETQKVVGTMMKIQGSTRSTHDSILHKRQADTKLVWSLEENDQQESGLPREFTFVFLVERPNKSKITHHKSHIFHKSGDRKREKEEPVEIQTTSNPHPNNTPVTESVRHHDADLAGHVDHDATFGPFSLGITIKPTVSATVNALPYFEEHQSEVLDQEVGQRLLAEHTSAAARGKNGRVDTFSKFEGYFNFANMKQDFEGLIELPGNAVTTMEPPLPGSS